MSSVATLAFVMAATPGPNNVLFAASGARAGYWRTLPMLGGMLLGFVAIIGACAAGVGGLINALPGSHFVLLLLASAYMAYLATRLWRSSPPIDGVLDGGPLLSWVGMALFQLANTKTWLATIAFVSGKLGNSPGGLSEDILGCVVFLVVVWVSASSWTLFGSVLRTNLGPAQWRRAMKAMAVMAALTILTFWW